MSQLHKAGRIKQETGYDPNGLIVIHMQGADLAEIQDGRVRDETRQVQNAIDWDKFLLQVLLNEWAERVGIEHAYYLPASQHSWAHKADTEEKKKTMRRHYDDLAQKTGFHFNETLGVYEKTLANPKE